MTIDKVAKELTDALIPAYHLDEWRINIHKYTNMVDRIGALFGHDNDVVEHMDMLIEMYTRATERAAGLDDGTLIDIWLNDFEFNDTEYNELIKRLGE